MRKKTPRALAAIAAATAATAAGAAQATDGNLYPQGPGSFTTGSMLAASQPNPSVLQLNAAATTSAPTGTHFSMGWGCPVPGSEIASVQWSALRYAAPSSAGLQVTANGNPVWAEGDVGMPQSPAGGRGYGLGLPGGTCEVKLQLVQGERRQQHARVWWIGSTGAVIRDVAPPSAQVVSTPAGWINAGTDSARIGWQAADNFGSDGITGQRIQVAGETRWSGAPGQGQHAADVSLAGLPDGTHPVRVEVDGDGTAGAASGGTIRVDRTQPDVAEPQVAYATGAPRGSVTFAATDATSGLANVTAEVNTAHTGGTWGAWQPVASLGAGSAGQAITRQVGAGLADGVHAWRVTARDQAGNTVQQLAPEPLVVDTQPPRIDLQPIPARWTSVLPLDVNLSDNLDQMIGLGDFEVEINSAGDGSIRGEWIPITQQAVAPGREAMEIPLAGLSDGVHVVRLRLRNGGPFAQTLVTSRMGLVRTDLTPPDLVRASVTAMSDGRIKMLWSGEDARSGVERMRLQWLDGWTWRTITQQPASDGSGIATISAELVPEGAERMRVQLVDAAGNARAMEVEAPARPGSPASPSRPGGSTPAQQMADAAREGILTLGIVSGKPERVEGREYRVVTLNAGRSVTVTGRLLNRAGQALGGFVVVARQGGRDLGAGVTGPDGSFRLTVIPIRSGPIDVGVPDGSKVVPVPTGPGVAVRLKATVTLMASSHQARAKGAPVVFRGKMSPAPGTEGGKKAIVLEWRDPFRRAWRPVVNARANANGSFTIRWRFQASGLTVPFRVRVPRERGWLIEPGVSKVVRVRVR
ncbi:MAG: hypothetical protein ISP32_08565 [Thermoleophilia bacterium]|nr:hypothetical protein [Thermoleophilia bacterium]